MAENKKFELNINELKMINGGAPPAGEQREIDVPFSALRNILLHVPENVAVDFI